MTKETTPDTTKIREEETNSLEGMTDVTTDAVMTSEVVDETQDKVGHTDTQGEEDLVNEVEEQDIYVDDEDNFDNND
jgi:hypothetical protein